MGKPRDTEFVTVTTSALPTVKAELVYPTRYWCWWMSADVSTTAANPHYTLFIGRFYRFMTNTCYAMHPHISLVKGWLRFFVM